MAWSITLNGTTYTDADFANYGYITKLPAMLADAVADFTAYVAAALGHATAAAQSAATALNAPGTQATSATSCTLGTGSKTFTLAQAGKAFPIGGSVAIARTSDPTKVCYGTITAFADPNLTVLVTHADVAGGPYTDWTISANALPGSSSGVIAARATVTGSVNMAASDVGKVIPLAPTGLGQAMTALDATTLSIGLQCVLDNRTGGYPYGWRDSTGALRDMVVGAGGFAEVYLDDKSTPAGVWRLVGTNLEPGFVTIDNTFSSTYASTVLKPFVALDSDKSIHFLLDAAGTGLYAVAVDNSTKAVGTPVLIKNLGSGLIRAAFRVSSTSCVVFYDDGVTSCAVVISLSGATTLAVGTEASSANADWTAEDFSGAPKIAQLDSTHYLASYTYGTATRVMAAEVSGTTVTLGTHATVIASSSVSNSTTTYALTATTGLVLYKSGAGAPYANNAVVISVSGTTCTAGAPAAMTGVSSSIASAPSSCLLSSTKALVCDNNNSGNLNVCAAVTISGTSVSVGAALTVDTTGTGSSLFYGATNATRYNPHLFPLSASTALYWYLDGSTFSRTVILTESGGSVSAGAISYKNFSFSSSGAAGFGAILPQGTGEFFGVVQQLASTAGYALQLMANKISGTNIVPGAVKPLRQLSQKSPPIVCAARLQSGDYVLVSGSSGAAAASVSLPVLRSNGEFINHRGDISCPSAAGTDSFPVPMVSSNRLVLLGVLAYGTTAAASTYQLRLLNVEVAQP